MEPVIAVLVILGAIALLCSFIEMCRYLDGSTKRFAPMITMLVAGAFLWGLASMLGGR